MLLKSNMPLQHYNLESLEYGQGVLAMHGVVEAPSSSKFCDRNMLDSQAFVHYLASSREPFVRLEDALVGKGQALTIDDATVAAATAALLARKSGHEVVLFINPFNVISSSPYFFTLLNALFDRLGLDRDEANSTGRKSENLRKEIKHRLLRIRTERGRLAKLFRIARRFGVGGLETPEHLRTIDLPMLDNLASAGVQIGNHSWTHADISALPLNLAYQEIQRAREWIESRYGCNACAFAVPFGECLPPFEFKQSTWLLNTSSLSPGFVGKTIFNRKTLKLPAMRP